MTTPELQALLWDVDGTLAETERDGHRVAFNFAFKSLGLAWHWDEKRYGELLRVAGGWERLLADMAQRSDAPSSPGERENLARELHGIKNKHYRERVASGQLPLRPGVLELITEAAGAGLRQAITTTTSRSNVAALLGLHLGANWQRHFELVVCGEDVRHKKPDPEVFKIALTLMRLSPLRALALEDSPGGVSAARAAGIPVVVTRSSYFEHADIEDAIAIGPGLHSRPGWQPALRGAEGRVGLEDLRAWRVGFESVSQFG